MFFKKRENDGGEKQIVMTLSESRIRGENAFGQKMMVTWYFHGQSQRDRARIFNRGRELVDPNDSQTFSLSFSKKLRPKVVVYGNCRRFPGLPSLNKLFLIFFCVSDFSFLFFLSSFCLLPYEKNDKQVINKRTTLVCCCCQDLRIHLSWPIPILRSGKNDKNPFFLGGLFFSSFYIEHFCLPFFCSVRL